MGPHGFNKIGEVLREAGIEAALEPEPTKDQATSYLTVTTSPEIAPARVLEVLVGRHAIFVDRTDTPQAEYLTNQPWLSPTGVQPGSITFKDQNPRSK